MPCLVSGPLLPPALADDLLVRLATRLDSLPKMKGLPRLEFCLAFEASHYAFLRPVREAVLRFLSQNQDRLVHWSSDSGSRLDPGEVVWYADFAKSLLYR